MLSEGIKKEGKIKCFCFSLLLFKRCRGNTSFFSALFPRFFCNGFGPMRVAFKIVVTISHSRRNLNMLSHIPNHINLYIT